MTPVWHLVLKRAPIPRLAATAKPGVISGLTPTTISTNITFTCTACEDGKGKQSPQYRICHEDYRVADVIISDTAGPLTPPSSIQHRHGLIFIDGASRYAIAIKIKTRAEVPTILAKTIPELGRTHGLTQRRFHSHNAKE